MYEMCALSNDFARFFSQVFSGLSPLPNIPLPFFQFFLDVKSRFPPSSNFSRFPVFTHVLIVRLRNFRVPKKLLLGSKINMKTVNKQSNPKISLRKLFELGIVKMRKFFAFQTSKCVKFKTVILHKRITD